MISDLLFRRSFARPQPSRQRKSHSLGSGVIIDAANGEVRLNIQHDNTALFLVLR